jgi:HSP20 family protein
MATQDKSRQQSSYMPSQGGQQSGGRSEGAQQGGNVSQGAGEQPQQPGREHALTPRQGTYLGGRDAGYGASPFALMRRLTDDMDRMFENLGMGMFSRGWPFAGSAGSFPDSAVLWSPDIEMYEDQGRLVVEAELPGMRKEDVQVQLDQDAIVISGERRSESRQNQGGRYMSERSYGSFHRVIRLPEGADADSANATFRDGILRIDMPLNARSRGRKLEIGDGREQQRGSGGQQQTGQQTAGGEASTRGASNAAQPNARNDDGAPTG